MKPHIEIGVPYYWENEENHEKGIVTFTSIDKSTNSYSFNYDATLPNGKSIKGIVSENAVRNWLEKYMKRITKEEEKAYKLLFKLT